jgi:AraC family transcriptional regulator
MSDKTKEKLLEDLSEAQRRLEERTEAQSQIIRKFQELMANDSLFSKIIDFFPYPMAIFTPNFTLSAVNKAFVEEMKMRLTIFETGKVRILRYKTDDILLASAVTSVFEGKTSILEDIKDPFSIFSVIEQPEVRHPELFTKAVIFPVSSDDSAITHGVIVFMT